MHYVIRLNEAACLKVQISNRRASSFAVFSRPPEWKYTNLKWHLGFDVRYERQFGVQAKTSGQVFVIGITYLKLFPPPHK